MSFLDTTFKAATVGGIAGGLAMARHPGVVLNARGMQIPLPIAVAGATALASVVSDVAAQYIIPHIPAHSKKLDDPIASTVAVATNFGATAGVLYLANPYALSELGMSELLIASAISEIGGDWVFKHFVKALIL